MRYPPRAFEARHRDQRTVHRVARKVIRDARLARASARRTTTSEQTDFGKGGYLDFSKDGRLTGQCIALQIKGGVSFHRQDGYVIPADRRRHTFWSESSIPVFGIVWDPAGGGLYWTDLTGTLCNEGIDATLQIPATNRIDTGNLDAFLDAMWRSTSGPTVAFAFGSDDADMQEAAAYDCFGLGRADPKYLVLLRRVMFGLHPTALDRAIMALNYCSHNGDNAYRSNWMSEDNRTAVRKHFTWTIDEAVELLDRTSDEEGFERGTFASCIPTRPIAVDDSARCRSIHSRPPAMTAEQIRHARDLLTRPDNTVSSIARLFGVSRAIIYKYVPDVSTGRVAAVLPPGQE